MALKKMLLSALLVLVAARDVNSNPVSCLEDVQCMEGYFCAEPTQSCHECFTCEKLGRSPPPIIIQNDCIKSGDQCGACLQGLTNDTPWVGVCSTPRPKTWGIMWFLTYGWLYALYCFGVVFFVYLSMKASYFIHKYNIEIDLSSAYTAPKDRTELSTWNICTISTENSAKINTQQIN